MPAQREQSLVASMTCWSVSTSSLRSTVNRDALGPQRAEAQAQCRRVCQAELGFDFAGHAGNPRSQRGQVAPLDSSV
jgi:hypothetical protein